MSTLVGELMGTARRPGPLSRRLSVLVICPGGQVGGAERWLFRLLEATPRLDVTAVVLGSGPLTQQWRQRGVRVTTVPIGNGPGAVLRAAPEVRRLVEQARPDVVLANGVRAGVAALPATWIDGTPLVWAKHDHAFDGHMTRLLGHACAAIIAPSDAVGRAGTGRDPVVVPPPRHRGMTLGQDVARARLAQLAQDAGGSLPPDAPLVLAVGVRIGFKGLTDAVAAVADAEPWHLAILGDDDPAAPGHGQHLVATARALGAGDRVHLLGSIDEAAALMPGADALIQLTRPDGAGPGREGYGMTVLEAACGGVPVVCTPCPAADELLRAGARSGVRLVPPASPSAVSRELRELSDPEQRRAAAVAISASSHRHPQVHELADRLASTLAGCAGRAGAGIPAERAVAVSVVAPLFAEGRQAAELVRSVSPQLRAEDEFIAVDDASPDDTVAQVLEAARTVPHEVQLVRRETNGGVGAARNSGVRKARHDLVVFVDAGTRPAPGWLDAMRAAAASTPAPGLLAGAYAVSQRGPWQAAVAAACYPNPNPVGEGVWWRRAWHTVFGLRLEADSPAGRSLAISRSAWEAIGGFDERRRAAEDVDAGRAVRAANRPCQLVRDALVEWDQSPTWRGTAAMYRHYGAGDAQADHRRAVARDLARAVVYPLALVVLLPGPGAGLRRWTVGAAALAYGSVPLLRGASAPQPHRVVPLVPLALMVKDLAKAWGALEALVRPTR